MATSIRTLRSLTRMMLSMGRPRDHWLVWFSPNRRTSNNDFSKSNHIVRLAEMCARSRFTTCNNRFMAIREFKLRCWESHWREVALSGVVGAYKPKEANSLDISFTENSESFQYLQLIQSFHSVFEWKKWHSLDYCVSFLFCWSESFLPQFNCFFFKVRKYERNLINWKNIKNL